MATSPTPVSALPTAPARTMAAAAFVSAADAFVAALAPFRAQLNDLGETTYANALEAAASAVTATAAGLAAAAATSFVGTSTTSLALTAGAKAVTTIESARAFAVDDQVVLIYRNDPSIRMTGTVTVSNGSNAFTVTVAADGISGTGGPYANWLMVHAAFTVDQAAADARAIAFALLF